MSNPTETLADSRVHLSFVARGALIGAVLSIEKFLLNFFVDFEAAQAATGLGAWVRAAQHWGFRFAVTLGVSVTLFAWIRDDAAVRELNAAARALPVRTRLLLLHVALVLPLVPLSHLLYGAHAPLPFPALAAAWSGFALAAVVSLCLAFAPLQAWGAAGRSLGTVWGYALGAALLAASAMEWSQRLWAPTASVTFNLVHWMLAPIIPGLRSDPANLILYAPNFAIQVSDICSGLEGVGLMLAFCGAWLVACRREFAFPRALVLIPAGLLLILALNVLRIAALMLIGNAGLVEVAVYGFHSQAGWIAFNCAACGIAVFSRRSAWLRRAGHEPESVRADNPTAAYLLPFLVALGGRMIVVAVSGPSGPWYTVPALAGAAVLWSYRRSFSLLNWSFTWRGVAAGAGAFALWMGAAHWLLPVVSTHGSGNEATAAFSGLWVLSRIFASVLVAPVIEELAYRGYLLRRLSAHDFAAVRFEGVGWWPLLVSSAVFAAAHGAMWPAALAAGMIYGLLAMRTGSLGEAVCAHAVTNALVAVAVVIGNHRELW